MSGSVAVIIPVYNAELYLGDLISSLRSQDYQGGVKTAIFVDDGSTDSSSAILDSVQIDGWDSVVLSRSNGGLSAARNTAIHWLANRGDAAEYILFLDSDDMLAPNALSASVSKMDGEGLDQLYFTGSSFFESEDLRREFSRYETYYERNDQYEGVYSGARYMYESWRNGDWYPSACMQMTRLSLLLDSDILFEEGIVHEDNLYTWRCLLHAGRVAFLDEPLYLRRIREGSTMTKPTRAENALGYFRSGMRAFDFSEAVVALDSEERDAFFEVADSWLAAASDQWRGFDESERERLLGLLPKCDLFAFRELVQRRSEMKAERDGAVFEAEQRGYAAGECAEHERVLRSPSFRLGRALTALPRKLMGR